MILFSESFLMLQRLCAVMNDFKGNNQRDVFSTSITDIKNIMERMSSKSERKKMVWFEWRHLENLNVPAFLVLCWASERTAWENGCQLWWLWHRAPVINCTQGVPLSCPNRPSLTVPYIAFLFVWKSLKMKFSNNRYEHNQSTLAAERTWCELGHVPQWEKATQKDPLVCIELL